MLSSRSFLCTSLGLLIAVTAQAQGPDIGTAPKFPEQLARPSASRQLAVPVPLAPSSWIDTSTRAVVQASYFNTFLPTKSVAMGWAGDLSVGNAGFTSQSYKDAVLGRINWVRALAGVPPVSGLNPTYSQNDQDAAMMMSVNGQLSHSPPTSWKFYSSAGALAAQNSNLCLGFPASDPGCIEQYMYDSGSNNTAVGHRRWILYPQTANMGTGDIPAQPGYSSANALWVIDSASYSNPRPTTRDGFVAWPPKGYVPYELLPIRWTFSYPGADFTAATVTMTRNGSSVPVALQPLAQGYGENTIAWVPDNQDPAAYVAPVAPPSDTTTVVTMNNVLVNGTAQNVIYSVTSFDPNSYAPGTTFNFNPPSASLGANGGAGTIALGVSPSSTVWGAMSNADWLSITAGFSGTGNGNINYFVSQNTSSHSRAGQISVGPSAFSITQAGLPCTYSVIPNSFSFVAQVGGGTVSYSASPSDCLVRATWDVSWINASFSSAGLDFTVQANAGAARTGHINISGQAVTITQASTQTKPPAPFGVIDTPINGATGQAGAINFTGWALSSNTVANVALCREVVTGEAGINGLLYLGNGVLTPGARPDVAIAHPGYPNNNWGWGTQILTNQLPGTGGLPLGNGTYKLHAIAADTQAPPATHDSRDCGCTQSFCTDLGTTTITVSNSTSALPFGTIDTPGQGQIISGTDFVNFGWVLTPQPNIVPIDASTIMVYIDNVAVGHPVYNQFRSDIATLFPGLKNSNGGVGYFHINTTKLSNGIHNIAWGVTDSAGNAQGIGSRAFFVQN